MGIKKKKTTVEKCNENTTNQITMQKEQQCKQQKSAHQWFEDIRRSNEKQTPSKIKIQAPDKKKTNGANGKVHETGNTK